MSMPHIRIDGRTRFLIPSEITPKTPCQIVVCDFNEPVLVIEFLHLPAARDLEDIINSLCVAAGVFGEQDREVAEAFGVNFSGEKDISRAVASRLELLADIATMRGLLAELDEWLAEVMPVDTMETEHGRLVRSRTPRLTGWRNDEFRRDALHASARLDDTYRTLVDPDTGEAFKRIDDGYEAGWSAANRLVTLSGDRAKKTALRQLGLQDDEYADVTWHVRITVEEPTL